MMVDCIIPSVNYGDFLAETLPSVVRFGVNPLVVTSATDIETIEVAERNGVEALRTEVWGPTFHKAAAINTAIRRIKPKGWLLLLDADILLPEGVSLSVENLDHTTLYSVRRHDCRTKEDLIADWASLPQLRLPPQFAELSGYFHLWHFATHPWLLPPSPFKNAAQSDMDHSARFAKKQWLSGLCVLHLGEPRINWSGRRARRW